MKLLLPYILLAMAARPAVPQAPPKEYANASRGRQWEEATIKPSWRGRVDYVAKKIEANKSRYERISEKSGVPWFVIGALHNMECSLSFRKHLHEGSSLSRRTKWHPAGRPKGGNPPFSFEESALDALNYDKMSRYDYSDVSVALDATERWNGLGYRKYHKDVPTPYNWSGTSLYVSGKYVSDGKWSQSAVSKQVGCAAIWKHLKIYK